MDLNLTLRFRGDVLEWAASFPAFKSIRNELSLQSALQEKLVDAQQLLAQTRVVDITLDGGQSGLEQLLNGQKSGWHGARL